MTVLLNGQLELNYGSL